MEFKHKDHILELGFNDFQQKLQEMVKEKKNMLVHIYGTIDSSGRSWCRRPRGRPRCRWQSLPP